MYISLGLDMVSVSAGDQLTCTIDQREARAEDQLTRAADQWEATVLSQTGRRPTQYILYSWQHLAHYKYYICRTFC